MMFGQVCSDAGVVPATFSEGAWRPLDHAGKDMRELIAAGPQRLAAAIAAAPSSAPLHAAVPTTPLNPGKIVAIGLNYADHVREAAMEAPVAPLIFAKMPSSVIGDGEAIVVDPAVTQRVDWEVELAVVVGTRMRHVPAKQALDCVFGYTVANDVSARDLQFGDGQWIRGKSLDTFCPLGPCIVTADAIGDPQRLALRTRVNGDTVQDSSTAEMIFSVSEILAYCSRHFTLEPGDAILTGTPWGCGEFMSPPRSLRAGDTVEVEIDGIGTLRNPVNAP